MRTPDFQIRIAPDGPWHRRERGNGGFHTACGLIIGAVYMSRDMNLEGALCRECFTKHEIETGEMKRLERDALDRAAIDEAYEKFDDEPTPTDISTDRDLKE